MTGRHRSSARWPALLALAVCLGVAGVLLTLPPPQPRAAAGGPLTLARVWPKARPATIAGQLDDGSAYTPMHFLDGATSVGTAPTADRRAVRLVLRSGDGRVRELRKLAEEVNPQFGGFAVAGDELVWAESTSPPDGPGGTRLWQVNWRTAASPGTLTADLGDAVFFNSQYDLVPADGKVYWVAAARTKTPVTELRSVPLAGGPVTVRTIPGAFALTAWPWLVSAGTGQTGPVELRNLSDGRKVTVPANPTELVGCTPVWCRVLVLSSGGGPGRIELMRPDGTQRRKVASGLVSASISDVAVQDRFEVLTLVGRDGSVTSSQQLMLYDAVKQRTVVVATGVGVVLCRAAILWWSTGDNEALVWHSLDLRKLR
ncbi:MAG TPA: hypothetical protein VFE14_07030 [Micromonosporaceae bacterium]|nr:hypothetical protein [Micromonosporaceae bacterium]